MIDSQTHVLFLFALFSLKSLCWIASLRALKAISTCPSLLLSWTCSFDYACHLHNENQLTASNLRHPFVDFYLGCQSSFRIALLPSSVLYSCWLKRASKHVSLTVSSPWVKPTSNSCRVNSSSLAGDQCPSASFIWKAPSEFMLICSIPCSHSLTTSCLPDFANDVPLC